MSSYSFTCGTVETKTATRDVTLCRHTVAVEKVSSACNRNRLHHEFIITIKP